MPIFEGDAALHLKKYRKFFVPYLTTGGQKRWSREGGIEVVVEELSTRMVRLGHQVTCYNRGGHHVSGKEFDGKKLHDCLPFSLPGSRRPTGQPPFAASRPVRARTRHAYGVICCAARDGLCVPASNLTRARRFFCAGQSHPAGNCAIISRVGLTGLPNFNRKGASP